MRSLFWRRTDARLVGRVNAVVERSEAARRSLAPKTPRVLVDTRYADLARARAEDSEQPAPEPAGETPEGVSCQTEHTACDEAPPIEPDPTEDKPAPERRKPRLRMFGGPGFAPPRTLADVAEETLTPDAAPGEAEREPVAMVASKRERPRIISAIAPLVEPVLAPLGEPAPEAAGEPEWPPQESERAPGPVCIPAREPEPAFDEPLSRSAAETPGAAFRANDAVAAQPFEPAETTPPQPLPEASQAAPESAAVTVDGQPETADDIGSSRPLVDVAALDTAAGDAGAAATPAANLPALISPHAALEASPEPVAAPDSPANKRRDRRIAAQTAALLTGDGIIEPLHCVIRDKSASGAMLEFGKSRTGVGNLDVGHNITLSMATARDRTAVACRVMWVSGRRCGVRFCGQFVTEKVQRAKARALPPAEARLLGKLASMALGSRKSVSKR